MSKRLQVVLRDSEYREIQRAAYSRQMSVAEWVRQCLAVARSRESSADIGKKLAAVRNAARHEFPVANIGTTLQEIETSHSSNSPL